MKGDRRCIEGRLFRHDPQDDDPELETDVGECPNCSGDGCGDSDEPVSGPAGPTTQAPSPYPHLLYKVRTRLRAWVDEGKIPPTCDSREHFTWIMGIEPDRIWEVDLCSPEQLALAEKLVGTNGFAVYKAILARKTEGVDK